MQLSEAILASRPIAREILRCEVGSTAHGVSLSGTDDFDMMGVCVEHPDYVLGTAEWNQTLVYRTAEQRDGEGARSQPGDTDYVCHSLRKFAKLAARGNPTILMLFFSPVLKEDGWAQRLRLNHQLFASKRAGESFLGYLTAQKNRMLGKQGQKDVNRPELVEKYGFDTKYAMHMLRLGFQGVEYMTVGRFCVPMERHVRNYLIDVREGKYTQDMIVQAAEELEYMLIHLREHSPLPDEPDYLGINNLLIKIHHEVWTHEKLL